MDKNKPLEKVYQANLPSNAKNIMFYLINRANTEGTCFPSVRTISNDCGMSKRTVQRMMLILEKEHFVVKESRYREMGGQTSNLYCLDTASKEQSAQEVIQDELTDGDNVESVNSVSSVNNNAHSSEAHVYFTEMKSIDFDYYYICESTDEAIGSQYANHDSS